MTNVCVVGARSPVDVYFASASYDRTARLWATDLVYPLRIFAGHTAGVDVCNIGHTIGGLGHQECMVL